MQVLLFSRRILTTLSFDRIKNLELGIRIILNSYFLILPEGRVVRTEARRTLEQALLAISQRCRNVDLLSIGYALRPDLRTD